MNFFQVKEILTNLNLKIKSTNLDLVTETNVKKLETNEIEKLEKILKKLLIIHGMRSAYYEELLEKIGDYYAMEKILDQLIKLQEDQDELDKNLGHLLKNNENDFE